VKRLSGIKKKDNLKCAPFFHFICLLDHNFSAKFSFTFLVTFSTLENEPMIYEAPLEAIIFAYWFISGSLTKGLDLLRQNFRLRYLFTTTNNHFLNDVSSFAFFKGLFCCTLVSLIQFFLRKLLARNIFRIDSSNIALQ